MVKQDASASIALSNLHMLLRDIVAFIARPRLPGTRMGWSRLMVFLLIAVITLDLAIDTSLQWLLEHVDETALDLPEQLEFEYTLIGDMLSLLILAPLFEEALFRGWLSGHRASLRFAGWGVLAAALFTLSSSPLVAEFYTPIVVLAGTVAALAFAQWVYTRNRDADVPPWFASNFHWFVWGSSLAFAMAHLVRFDHFDSLADMLIIAPQVLGGLLLAYSRTRFGLRAAMVHHATYNLVYVVIFNLL